MKNSALMKGIVMVLLFALTACGGGGGGAAAPDTVVSGVASAGIIASGTVKVYRIEADGSLTLIDTATTDAHGRYNAHIGGYLGPILVKAFGSYIDEATGSSVAIPESMALQAALPASASRSGTVSVSVTPLTDVAVRQAQAAGGVAEHIAAANQAVSQLFGVDVTATAPVPMSAAAFEDGSVTDAQKKYTAALATVSQLAANSATTLPTAADLQTILSRISAGVTSSGVSAELAVSLQQAVRDVATNPHTQLLSATAANTLSDLGSIGSASGKRTVTYTLRTAGTYSGSVNGVKLSLTIPSGVTLRAADGTTVLSDVVAASGAASGSYLAGQVQLPVVTFSVASANTFGLGEFATFYCEIPAGTTPPAASAFGVASVQVKDENGASVSEVTVVVQ